MTTEFALIAVISINYHRRGNIFEKMYSTKGYSLEVIKKTADSI